MKAYKESALSFQTLDLYLEDGDTREARGRAEGRTEGIARGIARGEARVRAQMILNCAAMGMSAKTIAAVANLSVEQVQAILQNRK
jgi:predicted transposase YdaD